MRAKRDVKMWLTNKCVDNDSDALIMIGYLKGKYNYRDVWAINVIKDRTVTGADFFQPITINELATYADPHGIDFALSGLPSGYIGASNIYEEIKSLRKEMADLKAASASPVRQAGIMDAEHAKMISGDLYRIACELMYVQGLTLKDIK